MLPGIGPCCGYARPPGTAPIVWSTPPAAALDRPGPIPGSPEAVGESACAGLAEPLSAPLKARAAVVAAVGDRENSAAVGETAAAAPAAMPGEMGLSGSSARRAARRSMGGRSWATAPEPGPAPEAPPRPTRPPVPTPAAAASTRDAAGVAMVASSSGSGPMERLQNRSSSKGMSTLTPLGTTPGPRPAAGSGAAALALG